MRWMMTARREVSRRMLKINLRLPPEDGVDNAATIVAVIYFRAYIASRRGNQRVLRARLKQRLTELKCASASFRMYKVSAANHRRKRGGERTKRKEAATRSYAPSPAMRGVLTPLSRLAPAKNILRKREIKKFPWRVNRNDRNCG